MKNILLLFLLLAAQQLHAQKLSLVNKFNKKASYVILVDFSRSIDDTRFWVYSTKTKKLVLKAKCAHGINSGKTYSTSFSNKPESKKSCLGTFKLAEQYTGTYGPSIKLDGLSAGLNSNARTRFIIIHSSKKLSTKWSWGCFSIPEDKMNALLKLNLKDAYLIAYR